jgi:fermentation-respiration switch protein FrsA (DUF1100 family)
MPELPSTLPDTAALMRTRYQRAASRTAPRIATRVPTAPIEGYWLTNEYYFFLAERLESASGLMLRVPSIADCRSNTVQEVIPIESLCQLLSKSASQPINLDAIAFADFDMCDRNALVVSILGNNHRIDIGRGEVVQVTRTPEAPALYSPDGRYECRVRNYDLWIRDQRSGEERPLTTGGVHNYAYGQVPEFSGIALSYRANPYPLGLWSPDSEWFLTYHIDERSIPEWSLIQHAPPEGVRPVLHRYKYTVPGDPLPLATCLAIHVASGRTVAFDEFPIPSTSCPPFAERRLWFDGGDRAWLLRLDRYSKNAELIQLDLKGGTGRVVLSEQTTSGYLRPNVSVVGTPNVRTLSGSNEIIWFSERDGWGHLYLFDSRSGTLKNRITAGNWLVRDIVHVDEKNRRVLFLAGGIDPVADPARRSLCVAALDGTGFEVLHGGEGDTRVPTTEPSGGAQVRPFGAASAFTGVSPDGRFAVLRHSSPEKGNTLEIIDLERKRSNLMLAQALPSGAEPAARHFRTLAADGKTYVHGVMFLPPDFDAQKKYPLVDCIYPGPQVACQPQSFQSTRAAQALSVAELGMIAIMLDTRGMPTGSRVLCMAGYGELLEPQLADHAAAVKELCTQHPFIDVERVGIIGASAGGAAATRALLDYGDVFSVGVAASSNHDSNLVSTHWSDRFRGPGPPEKWANQANQSVAHNLKGKLLLIHGDLDDGVHLCHTLSFVSALIAANRDFDLLIVPNAGHFMWWTNGYVHRRAWDYLVSNLLEEEPARDFDLKFDARELSRYDKRQLSEFF